MLNRTRYETWDRAPAYGAGSGVGSGIAGGVYLVIGVLVALAHHYLVHLVTLGRLFSAILAVVLWPLLLLGIHVRIG